MLVETLFGHEPLRESLHRAGCCRTGEHPLSVPQCLRPIDEDASIDEPVDACEVTDRTIFKGAALALRLGIPVAVEPASLRGPASKLTTVKTCTSVLPWSTLSTQNAAGATPDVDSDPAPDGAPNAQTATAEVTTGAPGTVDAGLYVNRL